MFSTNLCLKIKVVSCSISQASNTTLISWEPSLPLQIQIRKSQPTLRAHQQEATKPGLPQSWRLCWSLATVHQPRPQEPQGTPVQHCSSWSHTRNYSSIIFPSWLSSQRNATTSYTSLTTTGSETAPKTKRSNNKKEVLNPQSWLLTQRSTFA